MMAVAFGLRVSLDLCWGDLLEQFWVQCSCRWKVVLLRASCFFFVSLAFLCAFDLTLLLPRVVLGQFVLCDSAAC